MSQTTILIFSACVYKEERVNCILSVELGHSFSSAAAAAAARFLSCPLFDRSVRTLRARKTMNDSGHYSSCSREGEEKTTRERERDRKKENESKFSCWPQLCFFSVDDDVCWDGMLYPLIDHTQAYIDVDDCVVTRKEIEKNGKPNCTVSFFPFLSCLLARVLPFGVWIYLSSSKAILT